MYVQNGSMYDRDGDGTLCLCTSFVNPEGATYSTRVRIQENWDEVIPLGDPVVWVYPPEDVLPSIPVTDVIVALPIPVQEPVQEE